MQMPRSLPALKSYSARQDHNSPIVWPSNVFSKSEGIGMQAAALFVPSSVIEFFPSFEEMLY